MEDATSPLLEEGGFGAKPVDADTVRLLDFRSHSVEDRVASTTERYAHNRSAYWIMLLLGVGLLLPWNVVLNTIAFLKDQSEKGGDKPFDYEFLAPLAYIYPQLPIVMFMVKYGHYVSYTKRITLTLLIGAVAMALMPAFAGVNPWLVMLMVFIIGVCTAVLQSSLFGFASMFPPIFNQALMAGQGVAGIMASVLRIITKGAMDKEIKASAALYFALCCAVMLACLFSYLALLRMAFTQHHLTAAATPRMRKVKSRTKTAPLSDSLSNLSPASSPAASSPPAAPELASTMSMRVMRGTTVESEEEYEEEHPVSIMVVFKKVWLMCYVELAVFVMTFSVFPGEIVDTTYKNSLGVSSLKFLGNNGWWSVVLFFVFNVFDTTGRSLPGYCKIVGYKGLAVLSTLRFLLVPVFVLCATSSYNPFDRDLFVLALMLVFSLSNGYCSSLGMMYGPARAELMERETAGYILSVFLQGGICLGSTVALGVKHLN